ncbi:hypothetical protein [Catenulispora subtropica]|uniref:Uncharacterized protein n=1 Tax=Catenulispora subtropica TaxID=450798 RepID=A0ABN2QCA4_9ACTN
MIKKLVATATTSALVTATAITLAAPARAAAVQLHNEGCSLRTLQGAYSGNISGISSDGPFNFQATNVFNGDGTGTGIKVTRVDESGVSTYTAELTYTLDEDCTGTLTAVRSTGVTTHYVIVVTDDGKKVAMLQTDPGFVADGTTDLVSGHGRVSRK